MHGISYDEYEEQAMQDYENFSIKELVEEVASLAVKDESHGPLIVLEARCIRRHGRSGLKRLWELDAEAQELVRNNYGKLSLKERCDLENITYARMIEWEMRTEDE